MEQQQTVGEVVRGLRSNLGMTTTDLGSRVGISQAQISRLENGHQGFRSETLLKIAKALEVPPFRLYMTNVEWERWQKMAKL